MAYFSEEINSLQSKFNSLTIMIESISTKIAQLCEYREILGTETFEHLLNWQVGLNAQIKDTRIQLDEYYKKIEEIRVLLLG